LVFKPMILRIRGSQMQSAISRSIDVFERTGSSDNRQD
jgi:hypothetical protein